MKKLILLILVFLLVFSFSACNEKTPDESSAFPSEGESSADESSETGDSELLKETDTVTWTVKLPECFSEYREGVVRYSSIDPESDFAKDAVEFAEAKLNKYYGEHPGTVSFEITGLEIDFPQTNWYVNDYYYNSIRRNNDLLNNFLIIRFRFNIEMSEGSEFLFPDSDLSQPIEGHMFIVYDAENIYGNEYDVDGYLWKHFTGNLWPWTDYYDVSDERLFEVFYSRNRPDQYPLHTFIEADGEDAAAAVDCMREYLEKGLENDPAVLSYEIINIEPDINHTNWYINTVQWTDFSFGTLWQNVICLNVTFLMDVDDAAEKFGEFSAPWGDYDNIPVEYNFYLVRNYDRWEVFDGSGFPHDAFDDLTDIDLIRAINMLP